MTEPTEPTQPPKKEMVVEIFEGAVSPRVELSDGDSVALRITQAARDEGEPAEGEELTPESDEPVMSISLDSVSIEMEMENQSFGIINAVTGCASNVGGPSC
jgi:hypothetical protein